MVVLSILSVGALVAFFFYHRYVITKFEYSLLNLEAELDYIEEVIQTMRLHISEMELAQIRRSQVKKAAKKRGRPVNPNSVRQKKMKAGK
jgi:hypothetical protein